MLNHDLGSITKKVVDQENKNKKYASRKATKTKV